MLKLENVSKYYRSEQTVQQALRRVSLSFEQKGFVVITGESGSGKSTLLNVLSGLDSYEEGELYIANQETSYYSKEDWEHYRSQYIGFIFQNFNIIDSYTVYQNVLAALTIQGYNPKNRKDRAMALIDRVGLKKQAHQKSSTLSGGQKQRVSIARALAKDAPVIVADEPTGNLDKETSDHIIQLLKSISDEKLVIMVTHSFTSVQAYATRHVRLFDGEVVEDKVIKPIKEETSSPVPYHSGMTLSEQIYMAIRNLFSMPKRFLFMLAISIFIVLAFSLIYGANIVERDTQSDFSYNPLFNNPHKGRLIVTKWDETSFTQSELETLMNIGRVRDIVVFDPLLDATVMAEITQQGYQWDYSIFPASHLDVRSLAEGRLPENRYEVVISRGFLDALNLGDGIQLSLIDNMGFNFRELPKALQMSDGYEVVGIIDGYDDNVYFHQDFFTDPLHQYKTIQASLETELFHEGESVVVEMMFFEINDELADNTLNPSQYLVNHLINQGLIEDDNLSGLNVDILLSHQLLQKNQLTIQFDDIQDSHDYFILEMNTQTFNDLFLYQTTQIALIVADGFDAQRVMESLDDDTYYSLYPNAYEDPGFFNFQIAAQIFSYILMFMMFIVLYFITYITLKNIMNSRKKDYVIFRSIGATKKDLYRITIIELMFVFLLATIIVYAGLVLNSLVLFLIPDYIRFYTFGNYLSVIILLLVLAVFSGLRFNKKIFQDSVISALRVE